jgi:cell division protein ZapA (FtsZ GTPase activity inhibitor)
MSRDPSQKQVYRVNIFHQTLGISSSTSAEDFYRIADKVDNLMTTIASRSGSADGVKVGVLAAMHLADRLYQLEQELVVAKAQSESAQKHTVATEEAMQAAVAASEGAGTALRVELTRLRSQIDSLQSELNNSRADLAKTELALEHERRRVGRDADRLHSLLEQALDEPADLQPATAVANGGNPARPPAQPRPQSLDARATPTLFPIDE